MSLSLSYRVAERDSRLGRIDNKKYDVDYG
jgi:hypothetical protein